MENKALTDFESIYDIEAKIIANFLFDLTNRIDIASRLKPHNFTDDLFKIIFGYFLILFKENDKFNEQEFIHYISTLEIIEKSKINKKINELITIDYFINDIDYDIKLVEENSILLKAKTLFSKWSEIPVSSIEIKQTLDNYQKELFDLVNSSVNFDLKKINEFSDKFNEKLEYLESAKKGIVGIDTGYNSLNKFLNGFKPGELIILAARPGVGKTSLALNIMLNVANRYNKSNESVIMFSFEMSNDALYQKLIACHSRVNLWKLSTGQISKIDKDKIIYANDEIKKKNIYLSSDMNLTILDIESNIRRMAKTSDIKLVIIDYLQLITSDQKISNRANEVASISRRLKLLSLELGIPILALAQLSRNVEQRAKEDSTPKLSDLRESGAIEQDADIVLFLDQEDKNKNKIINDKPESKNDSCINIKVIIAKNRSGMTGNTTFIFDKNIGTYTDMNNGGNNEN